MKIKFDKNKISIELEITLECNVNCNGCNRLCNLKRKHKTSYMTLDDIHYIFKDFKDNNINVYRVDIMGGEPTLHPLMKEIYKEIESKYCKNIMIHTNGSNPDLCEGLNYYCSNNSNENKKYEFRNTLLSPKEEQQQLKQICTIPHECGISISKINGEIKYSLCGCGKSILILLNKRNLLGNSIKDILDIDLEKYARDICCHCQACALNPIMIKNNTKISKCFLEGIKRYYS